MVYILQWWIPGCDPLGGSRPGWPAKKVNAGQIENGARSFGQGIKSCLTCAVKASWKVFVNGCNISAPYERSGSSTPERTTQPRAKEQDPLYHSPVVTLATPKDQLRDTDCPFWIFVFVSKRQRSSKEERNDPKWITSGDFSAMKGTSHSYWQYTSFWGDGQSEMKRKK